MQLSLVSQKDILVDDVVKREQSQLDLRICMRAEITNIPGYAFELRCLSALLKVEPRIEISPVDCCAARLSRVPRSKHEEIPIFDGPACCSSRTPIFSSILTQLLG